MRCNRSSISLSLSLICSSRTQQSCVNRASFQSGVVVLIQNWSTLPGIEYNWWYCSSPSGLLRFHLMRSRLTMYNQAWCPLGIYQRHRFLLMILLLFSSLYVSMDHPPTPPQLGMPPQLTSQRLSNDSIVWGPKENISLLSYHMVKFF